MRTTGGCLPLQMFIQRVMEQDVPESGEASDVFTLDSSRLFGADEDGPIPSGELQQVLVPRSSIALDTDQLSALQARVNPLPHSDNYAIDLYLSTRSYLSEIFITVVCIPFQTFILFMFVLNICLLNFHISHQ